MINLADNHLSGYLPPQVFDDMALASLDVNNNGLTGNLPNQLPQNLESFTASGNNMSGKLPSCAARHVHSFCSMIWQKLQESFSPSDHLPDSVYIPFCIPQRFSEHSVTLLQAVQEAGKECLIKV